MKDKWVNIFLAVSALFCLLWISGLGWTLHNYFFNSSAQAINLQVLQTRKSEQGAKTEPEASGFQVLAMGDSLTRGTGDRTGKGYVGSVVELLKNKANGEVSLVNLGINGLRSDQLAKQVKQSEVQRQIQRADVILITIGGNDLFQGGQTLADLNLPVIEKLEGNYLSNLNTILTEIRTHNEDATVFLIGLYNPFLHLADSEITSKTVRDWNYQSEELCGAYPKTVFVPTYDLFQLKLNEYLYNDKFHPNDEGYRLIGERVAALISK